MNKRLWALVWLVMSAECFSVPQAVESHAQTAALQLVSAARERTRQTVVYDGSYRALTYPLGDVAPDRGVCTDVVVRSYRAGLGLDLQRLVHEDMRANFALYPPLWGLTKPDSNIDHRRVPNLQTYFSRHGRSLPASFKPEEYLPGDVVVWMLPGNLPHIGIVSDRASPDGTRPLIIHNIGAGPREEDALFVGTITGHYRYFPDAEHVTQ